ncbi:MAG: hypothetical protein Q4B09_00660 [Lachnospiraceae bacterium]|nr:hypothetical protein [Lachnospiraceae bacterium]
MKNFLDFSHFGYQVRRRELQEQKLKDFRPDSKAEAGISYQGSYMECGLSDAAYMRLLVQLLLAELVVLGISIAVGCVTKTGMEGCFYLLLPYAGILVTSALSVWLVIRMMLGGTALRSYVYSSTAGRLPAVTLIGILCAAAGGIGLLYAMNRGTYTGTGMGKYLFIAAVVLGFAGHLFVFIRRRAAKWTQA